MNILNIILKNTGLVIADFITLGSASKIKESIEEISEYTKKCNDALYTLQVQTFLNTIEVDSEAFEKFIEENPDNLRLGLETIKILEKTFIEKQAEMLARAFRIYIKNSTLENKSLFYKLTYIITKLDHHLINEIENMKDLPINPITRVTPSDDLGRKRLVKEGYLENPNIELFNFGFIEKDGSVISPNKEFFKITNFL
ncbi:hypothetical protein DH17_17800 [Acinetobacter oleivorans]|uniref:Uncharacterized protein n=1 Tax=Acinetobacter oleivorans TaxID=1148157 RepID=A0A0B2UCE3_9GAMM|nr:hypothetical protein DH17_17800 [Acinetobacter oleivorans]